jgi:membrane fusion protein, copper/silver efflux system
MKKNLLFIGVLALILGAILGRCSGHFSNEEKQSNSLNTEKKPIYWIDSMNPTVRYNKPGKSSMGMDFTPVYSENNQGKNDPNSFQISPSIVDNLGVRTASVIQTDLSKKIETVGYIEPNENNISHIHTYAEGWVRNLVVKAIGDPVKKNQLLLQYYSPMLVTAQDEYLIALESKNKMLINASYKKLQALHVSEEQIQQVTKTRKSSQLVDIYAPEDGIVAELNIRQGMRVTPETEIMSLIDLSSIWIIAQVFEEQANWVKTGEEAQVTLPAFPGRVWKGIVEYIYPQMDATTRTIKLRFRTDNSGGTLKPNMYANITLLTEPKKNVLTIPLEALIRSSKGGHVIVALGQGRFQSRSVTTGIESGNNIEILSGLKLGENIVISGQFLLDSEANLKASLARLETPTPNPMNKKVKGQGIIKAMNNAQHALTIENEAIPGSNNSAMTMNYPLNKKVSFTGFKIGDHVQFDLEKTQGTDLIIIGIKKLSN